MDACLFALITERERYGYELGVALEQAGLPIVKQGSIYLLLARLESRGHLESYRTPSAGGPRDATAASPPKDVTNSPARVRSGGRSPLGSTR